jgi:hypothetical protein
LNCNRSYDIASTTDICAPPLVERHFPYNPELL